MTANALATHLSILLLAQFRFFSTSSFKTQEKDGVNPSTTLGNTSDIEERREVWSLDRRRQFLDEVMKEHNMVKLEDWYSFDFNLLSRKAPGMSFLRYHYGGSPAEALKDIYSDHSWQPWRFASVPRGFWSAHENRRAYLESKAQELGLKDLFGWYKVQIIPGLIKDSLLREHGPSLPHLLMNSFPEHPWKAWEFDSVPKTWWHNILYR
jgi:hypothetical protein